MSLKDTRLAFCLSLVRMDDIVIIFVELVVSLVSFRGKTVITSDSFSNLLIFFCAFLIKYNEHQIKT